jgi:hypothetical protein
VFVACYPFKTGPFRLMPAEAFKAHLLHTVPPDGWRPDPGLDLDASLPDAWDATYRMEFGQLFQPVKLWSNANMLARFIEQAASPEDAAAARRILEHMIDRMRMFTLTDGTAAFIENRFDFTQHGVHIPGPWVSGIANAFAILACRRMCDVLPHHGLEHDIRAYANAYISAWTEGQAGPDRWISYIDAAGHLWFEEYPMPGGQPDLVLNGHIFAILALHTADALWPGHGYSGFVRGGLATVKADFTKFLRRGKTNIYSLRGPRKSDYLPLRTLRQQYELYLLSGDTVFLKNAVRTVLDLSAVTDPQELRRANESGMKCIDRRHAFEGGLMQHPPQAPLGRILRIIGRRIAKARPVRWR